MTGTIEKSEIRILIIRIIRITSSNKEIFSRGDRIEEVIFERRGEAYEVLDNMNEIIGNHGYVTVADFYELSGITSSYESAKYGWTDLKTADVHRVRDGYILQLPRAKYFD